ncbi:hypothetical protein [Prosthecobacter dejongeii]|uniref:Uncharacterized protein n=1 Tax=Prosthecobacter dejongeii TaxID=48465 RepID=A0A7W8DRZ6_9BACT|nr:hypothetical protein [Prosthecobacter dejongeii]MBB5039947.1 hypothetical protein [Prosthecobacter dejongeii]
MKIKRIKVGVLFITLLIVSVSISSFIDIVRRYEAGFGQKRVVVLANALKEYHQLNERLPVQLVKDFDEMGLFCDTQGIKFNFIDLDADKFQLSYEPKHSFKLFSKPIPGKLVVRWEKGMSEVLIQNSIPRP